MSNYTHPHPTDQHLNQQAMHAESEDADEDREEVDEVANRFLFFNVMPSWMVSFITHVALIVALALFWLPKLQDKTVSLEAGSSDGTTIENVEAVNFDDLDIDSMLDATDTAEMSPTEVSESVEEPESLAELPIADFGTELAGEESFFSEDMLNEADLSGNETSGRGEAGRKALGRKYGSSAASENAVELALEWLARHQLPDGGWNLDHTIGPDVDRAIGRDKNDPGKYDAARNGATALALLPFLGHGDTHLEGKYKKVVGNGLDFLINNAEARGRGISWHDPAGTMYSHGLVAIVLAEAYAMTQDSRLAPYAQGAIWFIEDAQDKRGGGWRYSPGETGDTSAVGWQLMALKSGKLCGLEFSPKTIKGAEKFLDGVSIEYGAWYGYTTPPREVPTGKTGSFLGCSAVGLLCRMYMGWDRENKGLRAGVQAMQRIGPSVGANGRPEAVNMYYNYYATQVMKHWGGKEWREWNNVMRDFLVEQQETEGTKRGSWHWDAKTHSSEAGGRLYQTAMAAMTLEVYYRYLPLYKDEATKDEFPLD